MKCPFPGMDPFIEISEWEDFRNHLVERICRTLAGSVPESYVVRIGMRSYMAFVTSEDEGKTISPRGHQKSGGGPGTRPAGEAGPLFLRAFIPDEHREAFIEIYKTGPEQRLVTCVEVLSPSNKRPESPGWDLYQRKRQSLLLGTANLVELDLLRGGRRVPMLDPWPDSPYTLLVARKRTAPLCRVWPASFRQPVSPIPIPLERPDPDVTLDLQPLIEAIYQNYRYGQSIDYTRPLTPPMAAEEAAWLERQLRERSGRK